MRNTHRICFIVNKTAGAGRCEALFKRAEEILNARKADHVVHCTEYGGHAVKLTEQAVKDGEKFIVAVGGDGTVNEVSSVLCGIEGIAFGILPFGTGNDVARNAGLPLEIEKAVDTLLNGSLHNYDMGRANGRPFINAGGFGFDVDVIINTEKHKKGGGGMLPYLLGIVDTLFNRKKIRAIIETKHERFEKDIMVAVVANGAQFGGGMRVAPEAKTDDGLFDVCLIEHVGLIQLLFLLPLFTKGKHLSKKPVLYFKTDYVRFETDLEYSIQLDGEIVETTPVEYSIVKNALSMVKPSAFV